MTCGGHTLPFSSDGGTDGGWVRWSAYRHGHLNGEGCTHFRGRHPGASTVGVDNTHSFAI